MTLSERLASDLLVTSSVLSSQDLARASALIGMTDAKIPPCDLDKVAAGLRHLMTKLENTRVVGHTAVLMEAKVRLVELASMPVQKRLSNGYNGDHPAMLVAPPQADAA